MNKKLAEKFSPGHSSCAGCAMPIVARTVLSAIDFPTVISNATGCMEVTSTIYPQSSWRVPYIHSVFGNAAATMAGVETAYRALKKRGAVKEKKPVKFVAFGGDGGTYDIGLQALSGALERRHNFLYVCYDNEGYMNTGGQRSGATPKGAATETTPFGKEAWGKVAPRKDLMAIVAAHQPDYLATANIGFLEDLKNKVKKAISVEGPSFLLVLSPCTALWKFPSDQTVQIAKKATDSLFWPLYEIEKGKYKITHRPKKILKLEEFYAGQGRFKGLLAKKAKERQAFFQTEQKLVEENWKKLKKREKCGV